MAFNPEEYLKKVKGSSSPSGGFDPATYLAKVKGTAPESSNDNILDYLKPVGRMAEDVLHGDPLGVRRALTGEAPQDAIQNIQRGMIQGATLGTSDEFAGAAGALKGALSGDDLQNSYVNARDAERANLAKAHAVSPELYTAGELAGGFALPITGAAKVWKATKGMGPVLRTALRGAAGAVEGGALGGASAAGYSEASSPEELAHDVGKGTLFGGLLGGLIPGVASTGGALMEAAANKIGNKVKNLPFETADLLTRAYEKGQEGTVLNRNKHIEELKGLANYTNDYLTNGLQDLRQRYTDLLQAFDESGGKIDLSKEAQQVEGMTKELLANTSDPALIKEIENVRQQVRNLVQPGLTDISSTGGIVSPPAPITGGQAKSLQTSLGDLASPNRTDLKFTEPRILAGNVKNTVNEAINQVPQLKDTNTKYAQLMNVFDQLGIKPQELTTDINGNLNPDVTGKLTKIFENVEKEGTGSIKNIEMLDNAIESLKTIDPLNAQALENEAKRISENLALSSKIGGSSWARLVSKGGLLGSVANLSGYAQYKAGPIMQSLVSGANRATNSSIQQASKPEQLSKDAYKFDDNTLNNIANTLMSNPRLQGDGAALQKAITTGNNVSKNAALFNLLQKKEGRDILRGMVQ